MLNSLRQAELRIGVAGGRDCDGNAGIWCLRRWKTGSKENASTTRKSRLGLIP